MYLSNGTELRQPTGFSLRNLWQYPELESLIAFQAFHQRGLFARARECPVLLTDQGILHKGQSGNSGTAGRRLEHD